jgi:hypothetical protein
MGLVSEQAKFLFDVGRLIAKIETSGLIATAGEFYRTPVQAWINSQPAGSTLLIQNGGLKHYPEKVGGVGSAASNHCRRLAVDFNFFITPGDIPTSKRELIEPLGAFWESLDPKNRWGGNFKSRPGDLAHFERNV